MLLGTGWLGVNCQWHGLTSPAFIFGGKSKDKPGKGLDLKYIYEHGSSRIRANLDGKPRRWHHRHHHQP